MKLTTTAKSKMGQRRSAGRTESSAIQQLRRKEIAEAAVRVFNRMGFQKATISAVAAELDIDRASIYYYISSKEELFDEIVRTVVERNLENFKAIELSNLAPRRKLRDAITMLMSSYSQNYPLFYIYIRENLSQVSENRSEWSDYMRSLNMKTSESLIAIIEQGYADKSFRNLGSSKVVAYGILGIVGWTHRWFRPESTEVNADEIGKIYAEMVLNGLENPY